MDYDIHGDDLDYSATPYQWIGNSSLIPNSSVSSDLWHPQNGPMLNSQLVRIQTALIVMKNYYKPCLVAFGILGNIFSCVVILKSKLSHFSCANYLAAILVVDILSLINLLLLWIHDIGVELYRIGAMCHITTLLSHATAFLSMWYTTCLAIDRVLHIFYGNSHHHLFSVGRAKIVIVMFSVIAITVFRNMSLMFAVTLFGNMSSCTPLRIYHNAMRVLDHVDIFINCLLPYTCLISVFFIGMVKTCSKHRSCHRGPTRQIPRRLHYTGDEHEKGQQTGPIVFIGYYLLLTLPLQSFRVVIALRDMTGKIQIIGHMTMLVQDILYYMCYTRSSLNVVILLAAYSGFRTTSWGCLRSAFDWARDCCRHGKVTKPLADEDGGFEFMNTKFSHEESIISSEEHTQEVTV